MTDPRLIAALKDADVATLRDDARVEMLKATFEVHLDVADRHLRLAALALAVAEIMERQKPGVPWVVRDSLTGRGLRIHQSEHRHDTFPTLPNALAALLSQGAP